jgi:hypothetical protein
MHLLVVVCAFTTFGVVNSVTAQNITGNISGEELIEAELGCSPFFSRFAPPAEGYRRYMDNVTCSSIDYPENWIIKDSLEIVVRPVAQTRVR